MINYQSDIVVRLKSWPFDAERIMKITDNNRAEIIQTYTKSTIDCMDFQQLWDYAYDGVVNNLSKYTNEELEKEIGEFSPEILENV